MIFASHSLTTVFATAWEFSLPLALLFAYARGTLLAPASLTLAQTVTSMFLGPCVGRQADSMERQSAMRIARVVQVSGTAASIAGLWVLAALDGDSPAVLALVLFGAALETLGALVTKSALKKDWVPTLYDGEQLSKVTYALSNVSQLAAILGPFLGSAALSTTTRAGSLKSGVLLVGIVAIVAELPAQLILERLYSSSPALRRPRERVDEEERAVMGAWQAWISQPSGSAFLTVSFSLLFFTVLAPHGAVLTAYLASAGVDPFAISTFRAAGAGAGLAGMYLFSRATATTSDLPDERELPGSVSAARVLSLRRASAIALVGQASAALVATLSLNSQQQYTGLFVFMIAVVCSRAGLYAYDVGYLELQQILVDEPDRTACSGVEAALCGAAEFSIAVITLVLFSDTAHFQQLSAASAIAVLASFVVFSCWARLYHVHQHEHEPGKLSHAHTTQWARTLSDDSPTKHVHVHYHHN